MENVKSLTRVESHLASMFDNSLFTDLSLGFIHPAYPFTMRFDVHRSIVSQSSFFKDLINNMQYLPSQETMENHEPTSKERNTDGEENNTQILTIHLARALSHCGFILAPFQHIIRRKWQKSSTSSVTLSTTTTTATGKIIQHQASSSSSVSSSSSTSVVKPLGHHILSSHIRFALRWMYTSDRPQQMQTLDDEDTLRVLAIAILFGLDDLVMACVAKYIKEQLSMMTIMRDLEQICQLPRDHHAYLQLRDATLLLLLRHGADEPECLSDLPVDYMADILSADMLFVGCEYDRYCLIREVLSMFMRSVGEITWTRSGPVDRDNKRLSGFVRPIPVTASIVRSRKRKRIPSNELSTGDRRAKYARLSFSATVPFQSLVADASSGGVIDKATVLSHLLKTTIHYNNMSFDQLTKVRLDGIVDEEVVFRALWQRQTFEQLLLPNSHRNKDDDDDDDDDDDGGSNDERQEALNDYFDVGGDSDDHRRQLLLGVPKYRFCMAVDLSSPSLENGWTCDVCTNNTVNMSQDDNVKDEEVSVESEVQLQKDESTDRHKQQIQNNEDVLDQIVDQHDDIFNMNDMEDLEDDEIEDRKVGELAVAVSPTSPSGKISRGTSTVDLYGLTLSPEAENREISRPKDAVQEHSHQHDKEQRTIWRKTFYSQPEVIWGTTYRVQVEAQAIPNALLHIQDDATNDINSNEKTHEDSSEYVLLCRFELQRGGSSLRQRRDEGDDVISVNSCKNSRIPLLSARINKASSSSSSSSSSSQPTTRAPAFTQQIQYPALHRRCSAPSQFASDVTPKQPRIRYTIHCLNRREGLIENLRVDPEDRVLVAVTDQTEEDDNMVKGYVGQIRLEEYDPSKSIKIDTVVCLEVFGFNRKTQ